MKAKGNVSSKPGEVWSNYLWIEDQWKLPCSEILASICVPGAAHGSEVSFYSHLLSVSPKLLCLCLNKVHPNSGKFLPVLNLCQVLLHWLLHAFLAKFWFCIWCWELFSLTSVETQMRSIATTDKRFLVLCPQASAGLEDWEIFKPAQIVGELCG